MDGKNTLLIAGINGQIGRAVMHHFGGLPAWSLVGLSRRQPSGSVQPFVAADLLDPDCCRAALRGLADITQIVYAARYDHADGKQESADINGRMLFNLLNAIEPVASKLRHIHLVHGTKYYGHSIRPGRVPYREDDERPPVDLFYYGQQDLVSARQRGQSWTWSISRPHSFCDLSVNEPRSMTLLVAVYATLLRESGLPLIFPGTRAAFEARTQFTWLPMLARAIEWMMHTPACANQAYNVVNGDPRCWEQLWHVVARYFDMDVGEPSPGMFAQFVAEKSALWQEIVTRHRLISLDLRKDVQWGYGDYALSFQWDVVSDMSKARRDGFSETVDTLKMWTDSFDFYRKNRVIP
jgi:nucleoside-diphosphate-sugar epimerase